MTFTFLDFLMIWGFITYHGYVLDKIKERLEKLENKNVN